MKQLTKEDFIAFLKSKPADEEYKFSDNENCAVAQFVKTTMGYKDVSCSAGYRVNVLPRVAAFIDGKYVDVLSFDNQIDRAASLSDTFGQLLKEVEAI